MKRLAPVILTLAGIWTLITTPQVFADSLQHMAYLEGPTATLGAALAFLPPITAGLLGVMLIARRNELAEQWFDDEPLGLNLEGRSILQAGLVFGGAMLLLTAVPLALLTLGGLAVQAVSDVLISDGYSDPSMMGFQLVQGVFPLIYALVGYAVIVRSGRIASWLWSFTGESARSAETSDTDEVEQ